MKQTLFGACFISLCVLLTVTFTWASEITVSARVMLIIPVRSDSVFHAGGVQLSPTGDLIPDPPRFVGNTFHDSLLVMVDLGHHQRVHMWVPCDVPYDHFRPMVGDRLTCSLRITALGVETKADPDIIHLRGGTVAKK